jgi:hypothetical protein
MPARATNLQLLVALALASTGAAAGHRIGPRSLIVIAHGVVGLVVVALIPWKTRVVRRSGTDARYASPTGRAALPRCSSLAYATGLVPRWPARGPVVARRAGPGRPLLLARRAWFETAPGRCVAAAAGRRGGAGLYG